MANNVLTLVACVIGITVISRSARNAAKALGLPAVTVPILVFLAGRLDT